VLEIKGRKGVTLSSSKDKYAAILEGVKKNFTYDIYSNGRSGHASNCCRRNNVGAVCTVETSSPSVGTCHVNPRYYFVNKHSEDDIIKIVFAKLKDKNLGNLTTNVRKVMYENYISVLLGKMENANH
jgi:hypothetical protein